MSTDTAGPIVAETVREALAEQPEVIDPLAEGSSGGKRSRLLLGIAFIAAGINHFAVPRHYERIVPPSLKGRAQGVVAVSGIAEVAGGLGVLLPWTRRRAGLGLIALLAAVFPANLYMARTPEHFRKIPRWALYARLPLQPLMMWWAWTATKN
jgi:uncharacterized membrane protein